MLKIIYLSGLDSDYDVVEICTNLKLDIIPNMVMIPCPMKMVSLSLSWM